MFDLTKRFSIGINIDDPWIYAGTMTPKSIIIPHLLSIRLPVGKALDKIDELAFQKHKHVLQKKICMHGLSKSYNIFGAESDLSKDTICLMLVSMEII